MAQGRKTGGRRRGTPNKRTLALQALAEQQPQAGTPLQFLTGVYRNEALPLDMRIDAAGKAAPYVHPRLAAVTLRGDKDAPPIHMDHTMTQAEAYRRMKDGDGE